MLLDSLVLSAALLVPGGHSNAQPDIVDTAVAAGQFETLAAALGAADLVDTLKGDGPFTVFAPTDEAFAKLDPKLVETLLLPANKAALTQVLTYHVVAGQVDAAAAVAARRAATVQGEKVSIGLKDGRLRINESNVVANDVAASNGIIHVIDSVLLPPDFELPDPNARPVIGIYDTTIGDALASQLHLDPRETLLINGLVDDGPAEQAGLKRYDILVEVDGMPCSDSNLRAAKKAAGIGGTVRLAFLRGGERHELDVAVAAARA